MISDFNELNFTEAETIEQVEAILQDKLGIGFLPMKEALSQFLQQQAVKVAGDFTNVVPHGDYAKLLEDQQDIAQFFREDAHQPDHWDPMGISLGNNNLIQVIFRNSEVDDGSTMEGYVFVSFSGVIRHAFVQGDE